MGCCNHGCHGQGCCGSQGKKLVLTAAEGAFFQCLAQTPFLPVTRFILKSSKSSHLECIALAPVYIEESGDSLETVKTYGEVLSSLEEKGLISLDYGLPLRNYHYKLYEESELFQIFAQTVEEGSRLQDSIFDKAALELGSLALTDLGRMVLDRLD